MSAVTTESRQRSGEAGVHRSVGYVDGLGRKLQLRGEAEDGKVVVKDAATFTVRGSERERYLPYFAATASLDYAPPEVDKPKMANTYDPLQRLIRATNPDGTFIQTTHQPWQMVVADEEDSRPTSPHTNTPTTFRYDGLGRQVQTLERSGSATYTTSFRYDSLDNLIAITDAAGNVKHQTFDGLNRKVSINDPDRGLTEFTYDDAGNVLSTKDAKGQELRYAYDGANRITSEQVGGDAPDVRYHYDANLAPEHADAAHTDGRMAWVEDLSGREYFSYDARGNLTGRIKRVVAPPPGASLEFVALTAYDAMDRAVGSTFPDGTTLAHEYSGRGLLTAVPGYVDRIDYLASGQRATAASADGVSTSYGYDARQRLTELRSTGGAGIVLQHLRYTLDGVGNVLGIDDMRPGRTVNDDDSRTFAYDNLYRLTRTQYAAGAQEEIAYVYDRIGNLVRQASTLPAQHLGVLRYGQGAGPHALTQVGSEARSYDPNGNLIAKPGATYSWDARDRLSSATGPSGMSQTHVFDHAGQRASKRLSTPQGEHTVLYPLPDVEVRDGQLVKYVFAGGERVAEVRTVFSPGRLLRGFFATTLPLFGFDRDGDLTVSAAEIAGRGGDPAAIELDEVDDTLALFFGHFGEAAPPLDYATLAEGLVSYQTHAPPPSQPAPQYGTSFYHADHLGSATLLTTADGRVADRVAYYPYGVQRASTGNSAAAYRFTGQEQDAEIGLYDYGARFYDPVVGRFLSVDPLWFVSPERGRGEPHGLNPYSYARNNPLVYTDPTGLNPEEPEASTGISQSAGRFSAVAPSMLESAIWSLAPMTRGKVLHGIVQNTPFNNKGFDIASRTKVQELKTISLGTKRIVSEIQKGAKQLSGVQTTAAKEVIVTLPPGAGKSALSTARTALNNSKTAQNAAVTVGSVRTGLPGAGQLLKILAPIGTVASAVEFSGNVESGNWQRAVGSGTAFVSGGLATASLASPLVAGGLASLSPAGAVVGAFSVGWTIGTWINENLIDR